MAEIKTIKTVRKRNFGNKIIHFGERDCCGPAILLPYMWTIAMTKEFTGMLCNFYMVALTALLPLYTRGTYVMLGDSKYELFRNVSLLCLGLAGAVLLVGWLEQMLVWRKSSSAAQQWKSTPKGGKWKAWSHRRIKGYDVQGTILSLVDVGMLCYGGCVVLSALLSSYGTTAWTGYREWYMGAFSQLIFVLIYFLFSRQYRGNAYSVYLWEAAFFLVVLLGFCSRLGWDPLNLMDGINSEDWEYSHLISTIGNINWFCGYCSVALAMPVAGYLKGRNRKKQILLYIVSLSGLILLCIQGSDVGPVLAAACLGVCLLWSRRDVTVFSRTLLLTVGTAFGLPCYGGLVSLLGDEARKALPADGPGLSVFRWSGWWLLGLMCLSLYFVIRRLSDPRSTSGRMESIIKGLWLGTVALGTAALVVGGVLYLVWLSGSEDWIEGRGTLWRLSWQGFLRGDWKQKLLGAGPDCFAEYIYSLFSPGELLEVEGHWAGVIFANAHNQWLNHLVNTGLLGLCSAVGILVTATRRYRCCLTGMLALVMYGVNSLVSFQQVLSTPIFFMILGICEYSVSRERRQNVRQYEVGEI